MAKQSFEPKTQVARGIIAKSDSSAWGGITNKFDTLVGGEPSSQSFDGAAPILAI